MELRSEFKSSFVKSDTALEAANVCYKEMLYACPWVDSHFVSLYIDNQERYDELEGFRVKSFLLAQQIEPQGLDEPGSGFTVFQEKIIQALNDVPVSNSISQNICLAACMFNLIVILESIARAELQAVGKWRPKKLGPLNCADNNDDPILYFRENRTILDQMYGRDEDDEYFRAPSLSARIGEQFSILQFVQRNDLVRDAGIPVIRALDLPECQWEHTFQDKKIKIASIPGLGAQSFSAYDFDTGLPFPDGKRPTGSFYIGYPMLPNTDIFESLIHNLDLALQNGANIVVFPEYLMSEDMRGALSEHLKNLPNDDKACLLAVFAGTTYEMDTNAKTGNNILYLLDRDGNELGKYYKFSPFRTLQGRYHRKTTYSESPNLERNSMYSNHELLSNRGYKCTLLDIDGIGRVLPGICRDVIDCEYTEVLCNIFKPSLLIVPACSPSVVSFLSHFRAFAETIHASALLCNYCGIVNNSSGAKRKIGSFTYPAKSGSAMRGKTIHIYRTQLCKMNCRGSEGGCVKLIEIDFSTAGKLTCTGS